MAATAAISRKQSPQEQVGPQECVSDAQVTDMPFDRGVIAEKPHRGLLVGAQLREHDQVPDSRLDRQIGEWRTGTAWRPTLRPRCAVLIWSSLHGFVSLEIAGNFASMGIDPDQLFEIQLMTMLTA
jgi:Tetracyclin repressor-like, C-terminal domain